jgi:phosphohistidine phosphatase
MDLYILRHGIAEDVSASGADRDRVLTVEGRRKTHESGKALRGLGIEFDRVLSSPFARAWQTAEIIVEELGCTRLLTRCEALSSGAPLKNLLDELTKITCSSLLIVGHEPDLSRLISVLLCGSAGLAITMKKGGLAKLRFATDIDAGHAQLEWLLAPKHLCRLG